MIVPSYNPFCLHSLMMQHLNFDPEIETLETSRKIAKFVCDLKISSRIHSSHNTKLALVIMFVLIRLVLNGKNKNVSEYWI